MIAAFLLLAQAAAPVAPASAPGAQSWSILDRGAQQCTEKPDERGTIIVCGAREGPRLPLPDERPPPDHPMPSNPRVDGAGALAAEGAPCSAVQRGCTVGVGPPPALVHAAVDGVRDGVGAIKRAFGRKPDKSKRIPIPLD